MAITYAVRLKMYPNLKTQVKLKRLFGNQRFVRNQLIGMFKARYQSNPSLHIFNDYKMNYLVTCLKHEYSFLKESDSSSFQCLTKKLYTTYKQFFKNPKLYGYPHFSSRKSYKQSYTGKSKVKLVGKRYLKLPKLGIVKTSKLDRLKNTLIKQYTILLDKDGNYYCVLFVKGEKQALPKTGKSIGLDMGLKAFAIPSDSNFPVLQAKHWSEDNIKQWQKKMSRRYDLAKKKVAKFNNEHKETKMQVTDYQGWQKAHYLYAKYSKHLANQRLDYLQKYTTTLVRNYDVIVLEDLKVKNMLKNHKLAHSISNASWRLFRDLLQYKCAWYGKKLILVNPKNTSRICSNCGHKNHEFDNLTTNEWLSIRKWECPFCHTKLDRDINAAINIKNLGLNNYYG